MFGRKRKKKRSVLTKTITGIIVVSPLLLLLFNLLTLGLLWLLLPHRMTMDRWVMVFVFGIAINGWFLAGVLFTYFFRDQSDKFVCPTFSCSLGENQGFITYIPPIIKEGKIIEPQYTARALGGFSFGRHGGIHTMGRVIAVYPTKYEIYLSGGGIACYSWLRSCKVDQVARNVRDMLVRVGAAEGIFVDADTDIWFSRTVMDVGEMIPDPEKIAWDTALDEHIAEVNRLKGLVGEKNYQVESYTLADSLRAARERPADTDFREKYHEPPESVAERTGRIYESERDREAAKKRRQQW